MLSTQLQAEYSHVLKAIIFELGGLAHDHMSLEELNTTIDNMLSKGVPNPISEDLTRWIHSHRKLAEFKIQQILGTVMDNKHSLVPDCFGRFHDPAATECKICLDRVLCKKKCVPNSNSDVAMPTERANVVYPISKKADVEDLKEVISKKTGQIARTLSQGNKVTLVVSHNNLQVLTLEGTNQEEANMATKPIKASAKSKKAEEAEDEDEDDLEDTPVVKKPAKKGKAAPEPEDDEDDDLDLEDADEDSEEEEEEEEEDEAPKSKKKAAKEEKPAKKEKKAAPSLNKFQAEFVDRLKTDLKDDAALTKFAKKLGVKWNVKEDARINRMLCVMAVKKFLGEQKAPKK